MSQELQIVALIDEISALKQTYEAEKDAIDAAIAAALNSAVTTVYVDGANGDDDGPGSEQKPFATVNRATALAATLRQLNIQLAGGQTYRLDRRITKDSCRIHFQCPGDNRARLEISNKLITGSDTRFTMRGPILALDGYLCERQSITFEMYGGSLEGRYLFENLLAASFYKIRLVGVDIIDTDPDIPMQFFTRSNNAVIQLIADNVTLPAGRTWRQVIAGVSTDANGVATNLITNIGDLDA